MGALFLSAFADKKCSRYARRDMDGVAVVKIKPSRVDKLVCQRGCDDCSVSVLATQKQGAKRENLLIFSSQGV
jgi:hypothetical protein